MKLKIAMLIPVTSLLLAAGPIQAESLVDGSVEDGKARAATCGACHGTEGNSQNPMWPNLAGQSAPYIQAQLIAFRDGKRSDPLMSPQSLGLSDEDIANLAVYFESLPTAAQAIANEDLLDRGEALYRGGNVENQTTACLACHGPSGNGNPAARYPSLRGQHAVYTAKQLNDYKSGARDTDGTTRVMRDIAARLNSEDIAALSSYVQGLK